jgi:general secretion pathway protein D
MAMRLSAPVCAAFALAALAPRTLPAQEPAVVRAAGDSVSVRFVDTELRAVIQALGRYLTKPLLAANVPPVRVSLETPTPVPRAAIGPLLRGLVESQGLEFVEDSTFVRIGPRAAEQTERQTQRTTAQAAGVELFVVRLLHARAADVAATVNQLFGGGGQFSGSAALSTGTLSDELRRNAAPPAPPAQPTAAARQSVLAGSVTIVPDHGTNALLIRSSRQDYEVIRAAISELDIRPLQVLIEVLIVEARHDHSFSLGTSIFAPQRRIASGDASAGGETIGAGLGDMVIRLLDLGRADIDAVLSAAASRGDVEIMSRPVLLATNNAEARLLVGSQRPFVQVSRSLPTDAPSRDQVVQYRDVGTRLTVRPTINQDGYVSLVIQQEVNQATNEVQFDAPVISTREAVTQVLVRDGQTIVLGGLKDQQRDASRRGVPYLSDLPLIGGLFGSVGRRNSGTELYLFLTPRILRTDADADSVTTPRLPRQ